MDLSFENILFKTKKKVILNNISGYAKSGAILSIMGETGSGKTTLLNILSGRITKLNGGSVKLANMPLQKNAKQYISYVAQKDLFIGQLTLLQTINFYACLKTSLTAKERKQQVLQCVKILNLEKSLHTVVGSEMKRGLSGGELKRLSIACELITKPSILMLDEPTSGLDSQTSYFLFKKLHEMCKLYSTTIITTIHQPSSQIFNLFNHLLLIKNGDLIYFGKSDLVIEYFSSLGIYFNQKCNPADFIIEKMYDENDSLTLLEAAKIQSYKRCSLESFSKPITQNGCENSSSKIEISSASNSLVEKKKDKFCSSFYVQVRELVFRDFIFKRSYYLSYWNIFEIIIIATYISFLFFRLSNTEEKINDREGFMFFILTYSMFSNINQSVLIFPMISKIFYKERYSSLYKVSAFFMSKVLSELPILVFLSFAMYTIVFFTTQFSNLQSFFILYFVIILTILWANAVGFTFGILFLNVQIGSVMSTLYAIFSLLFAGFIIKNIPPIVQPLRFLSGVYYQFTFMRNIIYSQGYQITCAQSESRFSECRFSNATSVSSLKLVEHLGLRKLNEYFLIFMPILFIILLNTISYLSLKFIKRKSYL